MFDSQTSKVQASGMYGKAFESMYEGSMIGAGLHVFAVWNYIIAKNRLGVIEINPKLLAFTLGGSTEDIEEALKFLQQPDPESRSKLEDGRRLLKEGQFQYRLVNWEHYDRMKSEVERREYNRVKQRQYRAGKAPLTLRAKIKQAVASDDITRADQATLRKQRNGNHTQQPPGKAAREYDLDDAEQASPEGNAPATGSPAA